MPKQPSDERDQQPPILYTLGRQQGKGIVMTEPPIPAAEGGALVALLVELCHHELHVAIIQLGGHAVLQAVPSPVELWIAGLAGLVLLLQGVQS